ncbi:MAG: hypothetical protein HGB08_03565 [Candidatus Moranbacteria bacterium]|nr:hypothetical protein [Candidatus Moranbacteria bacterium]
MRIDNLRPFKYFLVLVAVTGIFSASSALAICPVCTVAVGAGIGLSRYFGIDDSVTGLWIGGLTVSMILWTFEWMKKRMYSFPGEKPVIVLGYYALIVLPLYAKGIFGHPLNRLWGMDKLMLGIVVGSAAFFFGGMMHFHHKKKNDDKVYFPFQKVVFSVSPLIILSIIFYSITK